MEQNGGWEVCEVIQEYSRIILSRSRRIWKNASLELLNTLMFCCIILFYHYFLESLIFYVETTF